MIYCPIKGCSTAGGQQKKFYLPKRCIEHVLVVHNRIVVTDNWGDIVFDEKGLPKLEKGPFKKKRYPSIMDDPSSDEETNMMDIPEAEIISHSTTTSKKSAKPKAESSNSSRVSSTATRKSSRLEEKDNATVSTLGCSSFSKMAINDDEKEFLMKALIEKRKSEKKTKKPAAKEVKKKAAAKVVELDEDDEDEEEEEYEEDDEESED
jgi:hypothetical protein